MHLNKTLIENSITDHSDIHIMLPSSQRQHVFDTNRCWWVSVNLATSTEFKKYIYECALENMQHYYRLESFLCDTKKKINKPIIRLVKTDK